MQPSPDETIEVQAADGHPVTGDLYRPLEGEPKGIVVLCHGFKGYRTWGFLPFLAGRLRDADMAALSIDFSHNGSRLGSSGADTERRTRSRYPRPDLFRLNTIQRECEDLASVISAVLIDGLQGRLSTGVRIGVFGHSRGAVAAMVNAATGEAVRVLCTWSSPAHPDHFTPAQKERWRRWGELDFTDAVDGERLCLAVGFLDDIETNGEIYDLVRRASGLRIPHLIVHGTADLAVSVDAARAIHDAEQAVPEKRIVILKTGHTFGVSDPPGLDSERPPRALVEACEVTVGWFASHFEKGH
jgi:pimeloyl-ACP methyl ester carboxylesterase